MKNSTCKNFSNLWLLFFLFESVWLIVLWVTLGEFLGSIDTLFAYQNSPVLQNVNIKSCDQKWSRIDRESWLFRVSKTMSYSIFILFPFPPWKSKLSSWKIYFNSAKRPSVERSFKNLILTTTYWLNENLSFIVVFCQACFLLFFSKLLELYTQTQHAENFFHSGFYKFFFWKVFFWLPKVSVFKQFSRNIH